MSRVELHHGGATDVGRVRQVNEDAYLASPPWFVVADGMGGHHGGDVASSIVVEEFGRLDGGGLDSRTAARTVAETLEACQRRIHAYGSEQRGEGQADWYAGTTAVVAALVEDDDGPQWLVANLGDSRAYRVEDGRLEQVSVDHSVVQELVDAGRITAGQAAEHPERHVVTRALGGPEVPEPDYFLLPLRAAERLLLCSDGVSGMIDDAAIERVLAEAADPRDAAERVVRAAVEAGGRDNATAVVVDVMGLTSEPDHDSEQQRVSLEQKLGALP
jgi:protein phosphatase